MKFRKAKGIQKYLGLMFRTRKTTPLIFEFDEEVNYRLHSWFVFFRFRIYFYDRNNSLIYTRIVKPFESNIVCPRNYKTIMEIPL